jgi:hypothetical protein
MVNFKRAFGAAALAAASLGFAGSANAATYVCDANPGICSFDQGTGGFSNVKVAAKSTATNLFDIVIATPGELILTFTSANLTFGSFDFAGTTFTPIGGDRYTFDIATAGTYTLTTTMTNPGTSVASYSGTIDLAAVPEPAAWGMMIGGFAMGGMALRRRRSTTLATA